MSGGANWQYLNVNGAPQSGSPTVGGGGIPVAGIRSMIDGLRSGMTGQVPSAEYPDGYLGNVPSRRGDRLLQAVQSRLTQRNYQRGVHKGERIDPQDYYWTPEVNPDIALEYQARGMKWTQTGATPQEYVNHQMTNFLSPQQYDQVSQSVGVQAPNQIDPIRSARMQRLLPRWQ